MMLKGLLRSMCCMAILSQWVSAGLADDNKKGHLLDLYSGTGTIALSLASKCKSVRGVESVKSAVADARTNAKQNGIKHACFVQADLTESYGLDRISMQPDIVVAGIPLYKPDLKQQN